MDGQIARFSSRVYGRLYGRVIDDDCFGVK